MTKKDYERRLFACPSSERLTLAHDFAAELVRLSLLRLPIPAPANVPEHDLRRAAAARYTARILAATDHIGRGKRLA